jgi:hypothetical protein
MQRKLTVMFVSSFTWVVFVLIAGEVYSKLYRTEPRNIFVVRNGVVVFYVIKAIVQYWENKILQKSFLLSLGRKLATWVSLAVTQISTCNTESHNIRSVHFSHDIFKSRKMRASRICRDKI